MGLLMKRYILNNQRALVLREKKIIYISLRDFYMDSSKYLTIGINTLNLYLRSQTFNETTIINYKFNVYILIYINNFIIIRFKEAISVLNWIKGELK